MIEKGNKQFEQETIEQAILTAPHKTVVVPKGKELDFYFERATEEDLRLAEEFYKVDVEKGTE